jgi:chorismate mutase
MSDTSHDEAEDATGDDERGTSDRHVDADVDADADVDGDTTGASTDGGDGPPDPEGMSLDELREEIADIDRELVELIARRTYVADTIASVKAERNLPTTDESQEAVVMDRAGRNAERFDVDANLVKAIFRLLIELNKVEQRESR